jgi:hypothetical protein
MKSLIELFFIIWWIAGIVLAQGFWSTLFAVIIPFWSFYLVVEQLLVKYLL